MSCEIHFPPSEEETIQEIKRTKARINYYLNKWIDSRDCPEKAKKYLKTENQNRKHLEQLEKHLEAIRATKRENEDLDLFYKKVEESSRKHVVHGSHVIIQFVYRDLDSPRDFYHKLVDLVNNGYIRIGNKEKGLLGTKITFEYPGDPHYSIWEIHFLTGRKNHGKEKIQSIPINY